MIIEAGRASRISLEPENLSARYDVGEVLRSSVASSRTAIAGPVRITLELSRGLGGLIMRALIGAEFRPGSDMTELVVIVAPLPLDEAADATCISELGKPLIPGLPRDFAPSVLAGLERGAPDDPLPPGTLTVDRAGYDVMGSSEAAFFQAATLLRTAFAATAAAADVRGRLADRLAATPVDRAG